MAGFTVVPPLFYTIVNGAGMKVTTKINREARAIPFLVGSRDVSQ